MKISQRLFLAVIPAIVGVFIVAALAYWGDLYRQAPEWFVVVAAVTAVLSLFLAWQNTRYVTRRIERLAGNHRDGHHRLSPLGMVRNAALPRSGVSPDELDSIEDVVDHLSSAVAVAEEGGREREHAAAQRVDEYARLLDEASAAVRHHLGESRLALHIVLEHHFGDLNDSQDEMLVAARAALDAADTELGRLQEVAQLDRGGLHARRDSLRLGDVLQSLRPQLDADATHAGVTLTVTIEPDVPRIRGDRLRLQEALALLLRHLVRHAVPGSALTIVTERAGAGASIRVANARPPVLDADVALARRIIEAHDGAIEVRDGTTEIALGAAGATLPTPAVDWKGVRPGH